MPIATIVVPAFNVSHCIAETLRSLLNQTCQIRFLLKIQHWFWMNWQYLPDQGHNHGNLKSRVSPEFSNPIVT